MSYFLILKKHITHANKFVYSQQSCLFVCLFPSRCPIAGPGEVPYTESTIQYRWFVEVNFNISDSKKSWMGSGGMVNLAIPTSTRFRAWFFPSPPFFAPGSSYVYAKLNWMAKNGDTNEWRQLTRTTGRTQSISDFWMTQQNVARNPKSH